MHGYHIGVAFNDISPVFLGDGFLGLEESVQLVQLMEHLRVVGVDIFLTHALGTGIEHTAAEAAYLATDVEPGEHGTATEFVAHLAVVALVAQTGLE